jgi:hypothetical protein
MCSIIFWPQKAHKTEKNNLCFLWLDPWRPGAASRALLGGPARPRDGRWAGVVQAAVRTPKPETHLPHCHTSKTGRTGNRTRYRAHAFSAWSTNRHEPIAKIVGRINRCNSRGSPARMVHVMPVRFKRDSHQPGDGGRRRDRHSGGCGQARLGDHAKAHNCRGSAFLSL